MRGIVKEFPGVRALDGVDLDVTAGRVHCLLGQNGAGKSTLIRVLAGAHTPDEGTLSWRGEEVRFSSPSSAIHRGIATIYQELDLVPGLSVADNLYLGHENAAAGFVRRGAQGDSAQEVLKKLGHPEIPVGREVGRLSAAQQQIVSLARALARDARLIVMDEPSAVLAHDEVANLFRVMRDLVAEGVAVVYISHRLEEIRQIGDEVTVLKDGRTVASGLPASSTPTQQLVSLMTGRSVEYLFPSRPRRPEHDHEQVLLGVENLSLEGTFEDVSLTVAPGEIVGIAGLVGAGRSEVLETIYGARRRTSGSVTMGGRALPAGSVRAAVKAGMGLAPEERKSQALLLGEPIARNVSLASLPRMTKIVPGWLDRRRERATAQEATRELEVRPADVTRAVRTLSGGNQQKVVLARWLLGDTRLLLLDEPTRGVDVGARSEIYAVIRRLADQGMGVLLVSSEVPEVLGLADRVLVMREGRVVHTAPADELDEHRVLDLVMEGIVG
ncbi:sugar ABC transporter ATP-binding protein [Kineosporia sp. NBRC 101731]|uniref:sugar ABC transporter ATP-binding protein n=1 Tax=Kineosporia sp. NBRC 101731 TaxID=3032199 RepID=UPI00331CDF44